MLMTENSSRAHELVLRFRIGARTGRCELSVILVDHVRSGPAAVLLVSLHPVAYGGGVDRARMTKGPSERSSSYGKVQAAGRGVQVRSTTRSPMVRVWHHRGGAVAPRHQADQVGCARPLAAADAGAHRPGVPAQPLPRCGAVGGVDGGDGALAVTGASTGGI
jgi:hypothetical protein